MCEYGDTVVVKVKVPADLSHTGQRRWKNAQVDRCLVPIVRALQGAGIEMRHSCCGHGKGPGDILLQDGRRLVIEGTAA